MAETKKEGSTQEEMMLNHVDIILYIRVINNGRTKETPRKIIILQPNKAIHLSIYTMAFYMALVLILRQFQEQVTNTRYQ